MTPTEFMNEYHELHVDVDDMHHDVVDVGMYLTNDFKSATSRHAQAKWQEIKEGLSIGNRMAKVHARSQIEHLRHSIYNADIVGVLPGAGGSVPAQRFSIIQVYIDLPKAQRDVGMVPYGKGSPSQIAEYLSLALRSGVTAYFSSLQTFCSHGYVGLDCSGFVSNYMIASGVLKPGDERTHNAESFADPGKTQRRSLGTLKYGDILVWSKTNHVAIMEAPVANALGSATATVVESNARRGLEKERYYFLSVDQEGIFTVRRESESEPWQVRIFDWNLGGQ